MRRRDRLAYFITSERQLAHRALAPGKAEWRWFSSAGCRVPACEIVAALLCALVIDVPCVLCSWFVLNIAALHG
jgi:hypothetical protein